VNMNDETEMSCILIVDDTPKNIQVLGTILSEKNYRVKAATNGQEALAAIERSPTDLVLLDIMMPVMDGYETCRRIKENPATKDIPVIFLTAKTETEDIVKGFDLGAVDYIVKPFQASELLSRVATHIELKKNRERLSAVSRERKELVHVLCHDLTNPIGFLHGVLDLAREEPGVLQEMKPLMETAVKNSLDIIDMVRMMMAIEDNKLVLETVPYNVHELVRESLDMLSKKVTEKNITVNMDVDASMQVCVEKTSFVNSVINNLLTNAIKFSMPGSRIEISAKSIDGNKIELAVRDHGIGMSAQLVEDLFNMKKATSRKGTGGETGTGFGMPLVRKFVLAYGGNIRVISKEKSSSPEDFGTSVILTLPIA